MDHLLHLLNKILEKKENEFRNTLRVIISRKRNLLGINPALENANTQLTIIAAAKISSIFNPFCYGLISFIFESNTGNTRFINSQV